MEAKGSYLTEKEVAIQIANKALDVHNADPDDDLRTVSRQFLRSLESLSAHIARLESLLESAESRAKLSTRLHHELRERLKEVLNSYEPI